jgi:hypothetical protein
MSALTETYVLDATAVTYLIKIGFVLPPTDLKLVIPSAVSEELAQGPEAEIASTWVAKIGGARSPTPNNISWIVQGIWLHRANQPAVPTVFEINAGLKISRRVRATEPSVNCRIGSGELATLALVNELEGVAVTDDKQALVAGSQIFGQGFAITTLDLLAIIHRHGLAPTGHTYGKDVQALTHLLQGHCITSDDSTAGFGF